MREREEPLSIRPPAWVRVLGPVLLVAWLSVFFLQEQATGFLVAGGVVALFVAAVVGRLLFAGVVGTADGRLTVRNAWSTHVVPRDRIDGVGVDRATRGWAVGLLLDDGTRLRLDVTEVPFLGPSSATLDRQVAAIRCWLDGRDPPSR
ncbi:hypothetical protein [Blastococcus brunescens]|uniref:PH domain-containing protein n=1 Tax=Blastococcus brunescens TaxID=1564165 RepID=A0ABZ1AYP0_9ACTN|nr:hypothetical protein [Blastococcus sp. BMG 8361]WRL63688.1 hypothetical protein U6N30_29185 [Blastococcus sp. BMG 8361]